MNKKVSVLVDPPIKSKTQDRLHRATLAEKVASMVLSYKGEESFVVGVEGVWGSGKTSFIEMILEFLAVSPELERPKSIKFNPWNFSNIDALYIDFFTQLGEGIGNNKNFIKYSKKILQKVEVEPSLWGFSLAKFSLGGGDSLQDLRHNIEKDLREQKKKIVIVVDDIDRLDKKETREVFKLVKVNANFPNVIYLLAYDREKVEKILEEDGFPGTEYLKKIVQVSFTLPKPQPVQLQIILSEELDKILESNEVKSVADKYWDARRWGNLAESGFKHVFKTIRDINRYVSSWQLDYLIIGYTEVNPIDFLGIELIRVFAP
jgi:predicted KAP-like P-loop ATPase